MDIINYITLRERIQPQDAIRIVQRVFGLEGIVSPTGVTGLNERTEISSELIGIAIKTYNDILINSRWAARAREYLSNRGIALEMIERYQLGMAPSLSEDFDSRPLVKVMQEAGKLQEAVDSNLVRVFNRYPISDMGRYGDTMQGRIVIPIYSADGIPVGLTGRTLTSQSKYYNIGRISEHLYGINWALESIKSSGDVYLVEGPFDRIAIADKVPNTVATMGVGLKQGQVSTLQECGVRRIKVLYDGDEPGRKASDRLLLDFEKDFDVEIKVLPEGLDPGCYEGSILTLPSRAMVSSNYIDRAIVWVQASRIEELATYNPSDNQHTLQVRIGAVADLVRWGSPTKEETRMIQLPRSLHRRLRGMGGEALLYIRLLMRQALRRNNVIITQEQLAIEMNTSRRTINRYMKRLVDLRLVLPETYDKRKKYHIYISPYIAAC